MRGPKRARGSSAEGSKTSAQRSRRNGAKGSNHAASNRTHNDRRNRGRRQQQQRQDSPGFWGDPSQLPPARTDVRMTSDPAVVPRSLGPAPLAGHEVIAEHYFDAVYDRAVTTAGALAAAGGLIDPEVLLDERTL